MLLNEFMTLEQFAKTMNVSKAVVWRWRDAWGLPTIRLGRQSLVHEPAAAAWLKSREQVSKADERERILSE